MASRSVVPIMTRQLTTTRSFLTSPIVEIIVGKGDHETIMTAHQSLLMEAPLLAEFVNKFEASGPVRSLIHIRSTYISTLLILIDRVIHRDALPCQKRMLTPSVASSSSNIPVITQSSERKHLGKRPTTKAVTSCCTMRASTPWQRSWACQTSSASPMPRSIRSRVPLTRSFHMPVMYTLIHRQQIILFGSLWRITGRTKATCCARRLGMTLRSCALKCRSFHLMS
jgi:hypothetical protein